MDMLLLYRQRWPFNTSISLYKYRLFSIPESPLPAVATSKHEVVQLLLRGGANINQTDKVNKTPLHAAVYQGNTGMVRLLIKHGANINVMDKHGRTPLLMASKHGRYEEGRFLIKGTKTPT